MSTIESLSASHTPESNAVRLRADDPREVLALATGSLGRFPENSLVVTGHRHGSRRQYALARVPFPLGFPSGERDTDEHAGVELCETAVALGHEFERDGATHVVFALIGECEAGGREGEDPTGGTHGTPALSLLTELGRRMMRESMLDAKRTRLVGHVIHRGRAVSLRNTGALHGPPQAIGRLDETSYALASVVAGIPFTPTCPAHERIGEDIDLEDLHAAWDRLEQSDEDASSPTAPNLATLEECLAALSTELHDAVRRPEPDREVQASMTKNDALCRLAFVASHPRGRDTLIELLMRVHDHLGGAGHESPLSLMEREGARPNRSIMPGGALYAVTEEWASTAVSIAPLASSFAVYRGFAELAAIHAFLAWYAGCMAEAGRVSDELRAIDPVPRMAQLVSDMTAYGVRPPWLTSTYRD